MEDAKGDKQPYTLAAGPNGDEGNIPPNQPVSPPANGDYEIYATTNILPKTAVGAYSDTIEATLSCLMAQRQSLNAGLLCQWHQSQPVQGRSRSLCHQQYSVYQRRWYHDGGYDRPE
ncbi:unnamed protein product, partial [Nesidiocoris tenuis]